MAWKRKRGKKQPRLKGRVHLYKGKKMASHSEVVFAQTCDSLNIPWQYEPESFEWVPPLAMYTPDFKIECEDGSYFWIEYKGYLRDKEKTKMREIRKQRPDLNIRFVFEDALKPVAGARKRKDGTKQSHAEWAIKNGYRWANKFIPMEWLKGASY